MKFIVSLLLVMLTGYAAHIYSAHTPWWLFAIGALLAGWVVPQHAFKSWLAGFAGMFLLWGFLVWQANGANGGIFAPKMASILQMNGSSNLLMFMTALVGGLVAGFASLTGAFFRKAPIK